MSRPAGRPPSGASHGTKRHRGLLHNRRFSLTLVRYIYIIYIYYFFWLGSVKFCVYDFCTKTKETLPESCSFLGHSRTQLKAFIAATLTPTPTRLKAYNFVSVRSFSSELRPRPGFLLREEQAFPSLLRHPDPHPSPRAPSQLLGVADGVWGLKLTPLGLPNALVLPAVGHLGQESELFQA